MRFLILALGALSLSADLAVADCTSDVNDAFAKLRKGASFRMETKITNEQGTLKMASDYVLPDRMHQTVQLGSGGGATMEMILIAGHAWSNQGQGWAPVPDDFAATIDKQMKETVVEAPKEDSVFTCLGNVEFEGKPYLAFRAQRAAPKPTGAPTLANANSTALAPNIQTVYVDKATGLPVRNIVTSEKEPDKRLFDGTFSRPTDLKIDPPKLGN